MLSVIITSNLWNISIHLSAHLPIDWEADWGDENGGYMAHSIPFYIEIYAQFLHLQP